MPEIDAFADPAPHDGIRRDKLDRPFVFEPGHKGPLDFTQGKTVKGRRGFSRVTSFIDVLDSKDAIDLYHQRLVLIGLAKQPHLLTEAHDALRLGTPDDRIVKDALNYVASDARKAGDEDLKAARGTAVHRWCEEADLGRELSQAQHSDGYTFQIQEYQADVNAYLEARHGLLKAVHVEALHVNDALQTAGTPDRIDEWVGPATLIPGNADWIEPGDLIVSDIKTGSVDYSIGKFACQLGVYANSAPYDQATNTRTPMPDKLRRDWGLIIHIPAGSGKADFIWIDIAKGWEIASTLAPAVRAWRNDGKKLAATHGKKATLADHIAAAFTGDQVRELWLNNQNNWNDELTELSRARVAQFEGKEAA